MADKVSKEQRSSIMRQVKSSNTSVEILLRKKLWSTGLRGWRVNFSDVAGKPDIVFTRYKLAVFIDGCFWHGCPKCYRRPKSNVEYWDNKVVKNQQRDKKVNDTLTSEGWVVLRFWEHEVNENMDSCVKVITKKLEELKTKCIAS